MYLSYYYYYYEYVVFRFQGPCTYSVLSARLGLLKIIYTALTYFNYSLRVSPPPSRIPRTRAAGQQVTQTLAQPFTYVVYPLTGRRDKCLAHLVVKMHCTLGKHSGLCRICIPLKYKRSGIGTIFSVGRHIRLANTQSTIFPKAKHGHSTFSFVYSCAFCLTTKDVLRTGNYNGYRVPPFKSV